MSTAIEIECRKALVTARLFIRNKAPYFCSTVYSFIPHFTPGLGTLGVTNALVLTIDPEWFVNMELEVDQSLSKMDREIKADEMRAGVLVHEAMHVLRGMDRLDRMVKSGANHDTVNKAFDMPINHDLKKAGWVLPDWAIYPDTYGFPEGLSGEQYYELLLKNKDAVEKIEKKLQGSGGSGGKGSGKSKGGKGQVSAGKCGGCAGNPVDKAVEDAINIEIGRSKTDTERVRKTGLQEIKAAAAGGRGFVPGSLVEALNPPKKVKSVVPWPRMLQDIMMRVSGRIMCGQSEFSMRRPSRRSFTRGVIRPGMIERKPEIVFIEDSSGSMGKEQILSSRAEIVGCCKKLGIPEAWFVNADTRLSTKPVRVRVKDIMGLPIGGRGGTDFKAPLAAVQKLSPRPTLCIYTTDGDGAAPAKPPKNMEVVWCIVPTSWGRRPAMWGKLVLVSDDQTLRDPYGM